MSTPPNPVAPPPQWQSALEWLRCPQTGAKLIADGDRLVSRDAETRLAYLIRDGVPALLPGSGVPLSEDEWNTVLARHDDPAPQ